MILYLVVVGGVETLVDPGLELLCPALVDWLLQDPLEGGGRFDSAGLDLLLAVLGEKTLACLGLSPSSFGLALV